MKYSFFLIIVFLMGFVPFGFADYRGLNYADIDNGNGSYTWTGGLSPWLPTNEIDDHNKIIYKHYYVSDQPTYVSVQNGEASFVFDKLTCSAKIYDGGLINDSNDFILGSDSYVPKSSVNGSGTWSIVTSVNNAPCVTEIIETENSIEVSGTKQSSSGIFKIKYLKEEGKPLKTILEATNLTALTDRRFGVTQTQSIPQIIFWAGQQRDLANYVGQSFDRTWLEDNKHKLSNLLKYDDLIFDVTDAWENLESISINSVSNGMASVSFNYLRNAPILLPNETLIIDPTYSQSASYVVDVEDEGNTNVCNAGTSKYTTALYAGKVYNTPDTSDCARGAVKFDTSSIPDTDVVFSVTLNVDVSNVASGRNCDVTDYGTTDPVTDAAATVFTNIGSGTVLINNNAFCTTTGNNKSLNLGTTAVTNLQTQLGINRYTVGFKADNETLDATVHTMELDISGSANPYPTLTVIHSPTLFEVDNLDIQNVGDALKISGTILIDGFFPSANLTSIIYSVNGSVQNTNNTIQNFTSFPGIVNFGPFWYQQTTDSLYNHTVTLTVQDPSYISHTNNTSNLILREYDPDYFTALDPTQGLVNYTFPDADNIYVNRDTSGSLFNVECQYFTQANAFFNELDEGVWDNETNVLFYIGDTNGYYYIKCFNDGELFISSIPQNYSNALVPGLIIFDQLGGFFGAPSIILVIISILSLGTGRNYPIIMLIAASVTGILLALELLVLDPGLVVALIVMTGIGLFGIRKFY